ncbi:hypothetical protein Poli38472_005945 [Pythium oligandrum]|uniref:B box-type domain-containing protein n=1 Tax=Pythium oligandrum TaxID=41045 RepID=A0A8K1FR04_PYTOL|nr:hypothetical protein Poli38472_005945 [Pythium oligandrum]|eukprot:TMW68477.1 hypothetical protein Poli38472_005945 [Pythium oligandrum]
MLWELWENPDYDRDLEPSELKRQACQECGSSWAEVGCKLCGKHYCNDCEAEVHALLVKTEGDPSGNLEAPHRQSLTPCNVCQGCRTRSVQLYCKDCKNYQCEECCASHLANENMRSHAWFCVEGASTSVTRYSVWHPSFTEYAKMCRRNRLKAMEAGDVKPKSSASIEDSVDEAPVPSEEDNTSHVNDRNTVEAETAVQIKMERVRLNDEESVKAPTTSPIEVSAPGKAPVKIEPQLSVLRHGRDSDIVDLTGDDDDDEPTVPVKGESRSSSSSTQSSWVSSAAVEPTAEEAAYLAASDEDPVLSVNIGEYNRMSEAIHRVDQQLVDLTRQAAELAADPNANMHAMRQLSHQQSQLKNLLMKEKHARNAVVARLVVFMTAPPNALAALLSSTSNIPDAQSACHRNCARIEASILDKKRRVIQLKRDMNEAITMKSADAFAEINRIGESIATEEASIRRLQADRLEEFKTLCRFSQQIRMAAQAMS